MATRTITDARTELPALIDALESGEEIVITRHGRAVAVLIHPDALRSRRASASFEAAAKLRAELDAAREAPLDLSNGPTIEQAEEWVAAIRADRDAD